MSGNLRTGEKQGGRKPPPVETRFKPGQSGNPGGRPKKKLLTEELETLLTKHALPGKTWARLIAEALLKSARKGNVRAIAELGNRVEGRPLQAVEVAGADGGPVQTEITVRFVGPGGDVR